MGDYSKKYPLYNTETDIKTKVLFLEGNPKGYNIDKLLEFLATEEAVYMIYLLGIDDNGKIVAYRLEYAMAGFTKEEIKISVVGDILKIEASHEKQEENEKEISIYNGISYKNLSLSYKLFSDADVKKIKSENNFA